MKKMYVAIFLIVLVVFVFAGCLSFSHSFETTTTTEFDEEETSENVNVPDVTPSQGEETTVSQETVTGTNDETTTVTNEQPSSAETTTGSSAPSVTPTQSEYDYLKSGSFYMVGTMIDKTGLDSPYEVAITSNSIYMLSDFSGTPMGMLIADDTVYMVYPDKKAYLELSDSIMNLAGLDVDELVSSDNINFSSYGALDEAYSVTQEVCNGHNCSVYHFKVGSGESRVYMDGDKLVRLATYDSAGTFLSSTDVISITGNVPSDKKTPPSDYKAYKGVTGMFSFMTLLEDIQ